MRKFILTVSAALLLLIPCEARSLAKIQKRSLMVGVVQDNAPLGKDHRGKGVEYDLIAAISQGLEIPFSVVPVNSIRDGEGLLKQDKIDVLIAAYKESSRNASQFSLTVSYCKSGLGVMVPAADNTTYMVKDLDGKSLATTANADSRDFFKSFMPTTKVEVVTNLQDALNMLKSHEVAGIADDKVFLDYVASTDNSVRVLDATLSESSFVIAVTKEHPDLRDEINRIMDKLRTTTNPSTPSPLRAILKKYGLEMPVKEVYTQASSAPVVNTSKVVQSSAAAETKASVPNHSAAASPAERLDQLEAEIVEIQKEIRELRKQVKN